MTVIANLCVGADDFDIGQVLSPTETRIELTQFVPVDGQLVPYFWKERDGDRERFERQVQADERVESLTNLDGRAGSHLYRIDWARDIDGLLALLYDHDLMIESGWTDDGDRWNFRLRAATQEELSAFQRGCHGRGIDLDVRRVVQNPDRDVREFEGLTDEQHEAIVLALKNGYFDIPRGSSQADLAARLGISRQSFSRRLKRGQRNVFETLFWDELVE